MRVPFVAAVAVAGAALGALFVPRLTTHAARPAVLAGLGLLVTTCAWFADGFVLPRLYPAFHDALFVGALLGAALFGLAFGVGAAAPAVARAFAAVIALVAGLSAASIPSAVRRLDGARNLRIALVEHAPIQGVAVAVEARLRGEGIGPASSERRIGAVPGEVARSLDWTGRDLVLLTVDALRADHVGAYGYARPTTPSIDAIAREGTLFESAYCPTPHTSYSITSMLTGKYLRPLLALGLGEDSETWPRALRRYGWRTAAFYPPAVFFIDEERFRRFEDEHLGFEYAKVEFADPALREEQVARYLDATSPSAPIFLWVHFFEPHEPYVAHPEHVFRGGSPSDLDAYDSEIATADEGIGRVVRVVRARRPGTVIIVTADHGEEFGEHGGRYHGTTVYEEQVRVPLVVAGPGVRKGGRVGTVVQTIDVFPTALSAAGIPRPARVRGRDLGALLAGEAGSLSEEGLAFAETDDYALVAAGADRLVCERRAAACAMYRPKSDPLERRDVASADPVRFDALRGMLRTLELEHGRFEARSGPAWPDALRRGMQGETDAALDVASLLDDADVAIRRKAAEVCWQLRSPATLPAVRRALAHDEDEDVRRWSALALARGAPAAPAMVDGLLRDSNRDWRRRAALVFAERGDGRGCDEIAAWWNDVAPAPASADGDPPRLGIDLMRAEELLSATGRARCRGAVPALLRALADVRARPYVADALGAIGDDRARPALLASLAAEPYITARPHEARALLALGWSDWSAASPAGAVDAILSLPQSTSSARLVVLLSDPAAALEARAGARPLGPDEPGADVRSFDLQAAAGARVRVELRASSGGVLAAWLVPRG